MTAKTAAAKRAAPSRDTRFESVPVKLLTIDLRVQRDHLNDAKLNRIRKKWNPRSLGTLVVSERDDGTFVLLDGQHRRHVAEEKEGVNFEVDCKIHSGLSLGEEAELFVELNEQEPASPLDKHKIKATQGDPVAVALNKAVEHHGWKIGTGAGRISAVKMLEYIYYLGEGAFEEYGATLVEHTVGVLTNAWGHDATQVANQQILKTIGHFIVDVELYADEYGKPEDYLDLDWLANNLRTHLKAGPSGWLAAQRTLGAQTGEGVGAQLRNSLYSIYMKGKKNNKLPQHLRQIQRHKKS